MIIRDMRDYKKVEFLEIEVGEVCEFREGCYLKTSESEIGDNAFYLINKINVHLGRTEYVDHIASELLLYGSKGGSSYVK